MRRARHRSPKRPQVYSTGARDPQALPKPCPHLIHDLLACLIQTTSNFKKGPYDFMFRCAELSSFVGGLQPGQALATCLRMRAYGNSSPFSLVDAVLRSTSPASDERWTTSSPPTMSIAQIREGERQAMEAVRARNESAEFHSAEEFLERQSLLALPGRGGGRKLRHACQHGKLEEAREMLACGCQPTSTDEAFERTALHWAAWSGDVEVGELLFTHPSTMSIVDAQDHSNLTALHLAAERGHTGFIDLLMRKRADPLLRATGGNTPLHYAAFNNHSGAASFLLRKLILMNMVNEPTLDNMRNRDRQSPIELAESRGHSHLALTLTNIITVSTSEGEDEIDRLLNNMHRHRSKMQTAYLESTHKSIAENLASRPASPLLFPRGHEVSPELASQHLRSSFAAHAARRPQPQRASSPVPWKHA